MEIYWYIVFFVFGAIIGSFLNVVLYRMHTGRSLSGRSHCMSCGKTLAWYELFPVLSYLFQRGSCRGCRAYIPYRYFVVEILTGLLFALMWHLFAFDVALLVFYTLLSICLVIIVVYDIRHTIIPDECTSALFVLACLFSGYEYTEAQDTTLLVTRIFAGIGAAAFFGGLWYISRGRWVGFGDAKLAFPLGILVGTSAVFSMIVLSFWIGAVISVFLIGIQKIVKRGKLRLHFLSSPLTIKSEVPFAPFLILGFLLVQFFHADIFEITYRIFF